MRAGNQPTSALRLWFNGTVNSAEQVLLRDSL